MTYYEGFNDWNDIIQNFGIEKKEPKVIYAKYNCDGYEGSACVVYKEKRKYYVVTGSHCSCFGLEGQWDPEEYDKKTLLQALEKSTLWYGSNPEDIIKAIKGENKK